MPFYKPHTEKKITNPNKYPPGYYSGLNKPHRSPQGLFIIPDRITPKSCDSLFIYAIVTAYKAQTAPIKSKVI